MGTMMTISNEKILHAAKLAKIKLHKEDMTLFGPRITAVFNWIQQLQSLNVEGIKPLVSPMEDMAAQNRSLRSDVVSDGGCAREILMNAPSAEHQMFKVPKVVE